RDLSERPHPGAADDERRPRLHGVEGAVLPAVAARVLPVVGGRVDHARVGGRWRVEELGDHLIGERIGVAGARREAARPLGVDAREAVDGLVAERVAPVDGLDVEPPTVPVVVAPEPDTPVGRAGLVAAVVAGEHHLHDRLEIVVEQDLERLFQGHESFSRRCSTSLSIETRSWAIESRSRTVTARSSMLSKSTVTQYGVPISSWRR